MKLSPLIRERSLKEVLGLVVTMSKESSLDLFRVAIAAITSLGKSFTASPCVLEEVEHYDWAWK